MDSYLWWENGQISVTQVGLLCFMRLLLVFGVNIMGRWCTGEKVRTAVLCVLGPGFFPPILGVCAIFQDPHQLLANSVRGG